MIAKVYSAIPNGYDGHLVEIEGTTANSLPCFNIVGMASKTITEARERVRAAIASSDLNFPTKKVTVSLAPAELQKTGSHLDLPIALAILVLSGNLLNSNLNQKLFAGELSLDGQVRPVHGIINIIETAKSAGFTEIYVPVDNLPEAQLLSGVQIIGVKSLRQLVLHLKGITPLPLPPPVNVVKNTSTGTLSLPDTDYYLDQIRGQALAKRALVIALAGHHNLLISGPPGAGKTLIARVASNLLPAPSPEEQISIAKIHSLSGAEPSLQHTKRPFRAPHHTSSCVSIIGGGPSAAPGEISLAHHGILFLDELLEFPRPVLEALRGPLEDRTISISRAHGHFSYPANFILIATMNPCPCGHLGDPLHPCTCTTNQIQTYRHKLSGPILDRIDLIINVSRVKNSELIDQVAPPINMQPSQDPNSCPEHTSALASIANALVLQSKRYNTATRYNSTIRPSEIANYVPLSPSTAKLLKQAISHLNLSARAYFKVLRIARTIADLCDSSQILPSHLSEALSFRQTLPEH